MVMVAVQHAQLKPATLDLGLQPLALISVEIYEGTVDFTHPDHLHHTVTTETM